MKWEKIVDPKLLTGMRPGAGILIIAKYPDSNIWSDVVHSWWMANEEKWARWSHDFPPTHFTPVENPED